jgi:hypothetical protein
MQPLQCSRASLGQLYKQATRMACNTRQQLVSTVQPQTTTEQNRPPCMPCAVQSSLGRLLGTTVYYAPTLYPAVLAANRSSRGGVQQSVCGDNRALRSPRSISTQWLRLVRSLQHIWLEATIHRPSGAATATQALSHSQWLTGTRTSHMAHGTHYRPNGRGSCILPHMLPLCA